MYMYTFLYICICTHHTHLCMYTFMYVYVYISIYMYMYTSHTNSHHQQDFMQSSKTQMTAIQDSLEDNRRIERLKPAGRRTTRQWIALLQKIEQDAVDASPSLVFRAQSFSAEEDVYASKRNEYYKKWYRQGLLKANVTWGQHRDDAKVSMVLCAFILALIPTISFGIVTRHCSGVCTSLTPLWKPTFSIKLGYCVLAVLCVVN